MYCKHLRERKRERERDIEMINKYVRYSTLDRVSQRLIDDEESARLKRARYFAQLNQSKKSSTRNSNFDGEISKRRDRS
jgi:hypothetical protein